MFYNLKYRLWSKVANWWSTFKPGCRHWFHVISPKSDGRREIEVSECRVCKQLTSELYVKGEKFEDHYEHITGYGPVEACPVTDDPPVEFKTGPVILLKNKELYFERHSDLVKTDRNPGKSKKAPRPSRRSKLTTARSKHRP